MKGREEEEEEGVWVKKKNRAFFCVFLSDFFNSLPRPPRSPPFFVVC